MLNLSHLKYKTAQCVSRNTYILLYSYFMKSAHDNPKRYFVWFWVHSSSKKIERIAREAMDICLWVLKESKKSRFDSCGVRNSVLIISHITYRDCCVHTFSNNLSQTNLAITERILACWLVESYGLWEYRPWKWRNMSRSAGCFVFGLKLCSETTCLRLVVPLEFWTFYYVISMVYKSADHEKLWSIC